MIEPNFEPLRLLQDNAPVDRFCGLSMREIRILLRNPVGETLPVSFQDDIQDSTLDAIPFFRLTEEFLKIIQRDGYIRLTPSGALPRKVLVELYDKRFITEMYVEAGFVKLRSEHDSISLTTMRVNARLAKTIKKLKGKLLLSRKGEKLLLPENRLKLFHEIFSTFLHQFYWSDNDGYSGHPIGQLGSGYTLYLLGRFGSEERTLGFYSELYLKALPDFLRISRYTQTDLQEDRLHDCYWIRTFDRFLEWFGFVEVQRTVKRDNSANDIVVCTGAFRSLFTFESIP